MKKIVVLGASAALAALPIFGAFADSSVTDTVVVTIADSCSISAATGTNSSTTPMTNGQLKSDISGARMTVSCNDAGGWYVTAIGSSEGTNVTAMKPTGNGTPISTGTATNGDNSQWAFKLTGNKVNPSYSEGFKAIPGTAADVAYSSTSSAGETIDATYQVYISPTQQADTYTGKVTYTLSHPQGTHNGGN